MELIIQQAQSVATYKEGNSEEADRLYGHPEHKPRIQMRTITWHFSSQCW